MIIHRTPINYLLVNLAIADALYATFATIQTFLKITFTHPGGTIGTVLCKLVTGGGLTWIAGNSTLITLVAIAAERYYAVIHPNVGKFTKGKLKVSHLQKSIQYIPRMRIDLLRILIAYSNSEYTSLYEKGLKAKCFLCFLP